MTTPPSPAFCACCEPRQSPAPALIFNRPGLSEIAWRTGTYATYRQGLIETIAAGPRNPADPDDPAWPAQARAALSGLTTRDDADYAMLFIDLFAAVADVLGFYSERYVNEIFLRTANERESLLRLVGLIGYRLAPGLSATTTLAFALEKAASVELRAGLKVMSVPAQDQRPQTFETLAGIKADARLNELPLFGAPVAIAPFAQGRSLLPILRRPDPLLAGDTIAIIGGDVLELKTVRAVETLADGQYLSLTDPIQAPNVAKQAFKLKRALRFFGHNAPDSHAFYDANPALSPLKRWVTRVAGVDYQVGFAAGLVRYPLDAGIDDIKPGALMMVDRGAGVAGRYAFAVVTTIERDKVALGPLADTVTWIGLSPVAADGVTPLGGAGWPAMLDRRRTRIFELERPAILARAYAYPDALSGGSAHIRSDHLDDPTLLARKQAILIADGVHRVTAHIGSVTVLPPGGDGVGHVVIGFSPSIGAAMRGARMNGNVARASHGETQPDEPLGHGDSSRSFQSFKLQRKLLTRLASGGQIAPRAELAVRVNGELWDEAPSLYGQGPNDRVYTVREADDGATVIRFGDGRTGARLPSGANNVIARYRTGLGLEGRAAAGQLTTLLARPVGLRDVTNALAADGGADPETVTDARAAAPATVRTFGRAISLMDFEDVARQTGLAARARATWAWIGVERAIQLTVAGANGQRLSPDALSALYAALGRARDPNHMLILGNLWRAPIVVSARLQRDPRHETDAVADAARTALLAFMAFDHQPLGRPLHQSQVIAALQAARGVAAVDLERLHIKGFASWTAAQLARRGATAAPAQPHIRLFDSRPRPVTAAPDPLTLAGLMRDPDARALPAEQAFIETPSTDIDLVVVEAL